MFYFLQLNGFSEQPIMLDLNAADHRSRSRQSLVTSASAERTGEPRLAAGMIWYLVSLGLIAVAIIVVFAIASFSSLYGGKGIDPRAGAADREEVSSIRPDLPPANEETAAPVKPDTSPPPPDASALLAPSPLPSAEAVEAPMPEAGPLQPAGQPSSPGEAALQAKPEAAPEDATPTPSPPGELPGQLFRDFAIRQRHQQATPDPVTVAPIPKSAAPSARDRQSYEYRLRTNTDFRNSRVKKECGPITDPALHRHCVASFNIHYPGR